MGMGLILRIPCFLTSSGLITNDFGITIHFTVKLTTTISGIPVPELNLNYGGRAKDDPGTSGSQHMESLFF